MTVVLDQCTLDNGAYISMSAVVEYGRLVYRVTQCKMDKRTRLCGYPEREITYADTNKARATYRRWVRKESRRVAK